MISVKQQLVGTGIIEGLYTNYLQHHQLNGHESEQTWEDSDDWEASRGAVHGGHRELDVT